MDNTTNSLAEKSRLRQMIDSYGVPRMIITGFLLLMFVLVPFAGVDFATQISNVINRFSWNAIMVLAMVPMVHSGCGLNFGLPLGILLHVHDVAAAAVQEARDGVGLLRLRPSYHHLPRGLL